MCFRTQPVGYFQLHKFFLSYLCYNLSMKRTMKFAFANSSLKDAKFVIIGVPDESGSHSYRKGTSQGPNAIRDVFNKRNVIIRKGEKGFYQSETGLLTARIHDYCNVQKKMVSAIIEGIAKQGKIPVVMGGDHSITAEVLKGLNKLNKKISVVYFDSHPDFICSSSGYYGSVVCDIRQYKNIQFSKSIEVGIREPEREELINLRKSRLKTITPFDIADIGLKKTADIIKNMVKKNHVYISIDMDVIDPAFAPGVSTPSPGGLSAAEIIYLAKKLAKMKLIGFDVMEVCPKYDVQNITAHLASKIIVETIASAN